VECGCFRARGAITESTAGGSQLPVSWRAHGSAQRPDPWASSSRPPTTHMRCSPSSGISPILPISLPILPTPYLMTTIARACVEGTYAACLGDGAGVKSRSPRAGARSAGLEAGTITQAQSFVSFGSDRSCGVMPVGFARSSRFSSQPDTPCGLVPHQLISGRRSQRPHQEPPYLGQQAGQTGPFFNAACCSPSWVRSRALDFGELIRPDRTSSSLLSHGAMSLCPVLRPLRRRPG
jgi:hypothetical protein